MRELSSKSYYSYFPNYTEKSLRTGFGKYFLKAPYNKCFRLVDRNVFAIIPQKEPETICGKMDVTIFQ